MKHLEAKYRVDSFEPISKLLAELNIKPNKMSTSIHYYARQPGNDVVKLVVHEGSAEIHTLSEQNGQFALTKNIKVADETAGFEWLKTRGFDLVNVIRMTHTDYEYRGGLIGLYTINDFLHSVILDFPYASQAKMAKLFGLEAAQSILIPYNKYLKQINQSQTLEL